MTALFPIPQTAAITMTLPQFVTVPATPARRYYAVIPENCASDAVPLVVVHGISRNAAELALRFGELAALHGIPVIAPLFERGSFGRYQQVRDPDGALHCDDALFDILADAAVRFGMHGAQCNLFGFSGGAQFAHRFAMLHPHKVRHCIAAAAGWYTMPDCCLPWPLGLQDAPGPIDHAALADVRFDVLVGSLDRRQDKALRRSDAIDAVQGVHRLQRARRWDRAMRKAGFSCGLTIIPGLSHAFGDAVQLGLVPLVLHQLGAGRAKPEEPET
ncbi:hypothetical protein [Novosphingobium subterraneum]|uniref:Uncharacterized protein n=1 Tax=Novosphingobium subterraneum TaxID=48936 RepID=A0A0B8ZI45_9SPHN|nr:hypothetical protein [Novosphingobium subterraneum]KHS42697.1 hypothetical protein NJ75_04012 [Novosphingobium subterraneum]